MTMQKNICFFQRGWAILFGLRLGLFGRRGNGVVVLIFCHSVLLLFFLLPAVRGLSVYFPV